MKKLIALFLCVVTVLTFCACLAGCASKPQGGETTDNEQNDKKNEGTSNDDNASATMLQIDGLLYKLDDTGKSYSVGGAVFDGVYEFTVKDEIEGLPVTAIAAEAFKEVKAEEKYEIVLGKNIKTIGKYAFHKSNVKEVEFNEGLETIEEHAFDESKITKAILPDSLTSLQPFAFYYCSRLTTVVIGENLTELKTHVFSKCSSLGKLTIGKNVKEITLAVQECSSLKTIDFAPDGVLETIGICAFYACGLEEVNVPDTVTTIDNQAFAKCTDLKKVTLGIKVNFIGEGAFANDFDTYQAKGDTSNYTKSIEEIVFKNPEGWFQSTKREATSSADFNVSAEDLSDPAKAANWVANLRRFFNWKTSCPK